MKLNRKWMLVVALVMSVAMATTGTLAYLTDRDSEVNVFTMGNVDIDLKEEFEQDATLMPGEKITKEPTIENTGRNNAWVWMTIAIPAELQDLSNPDNNVIHYAYNSDNFTDEKWMWGDTLDTTKDGIEYKVYTALYQTPLAPNAVTESTIYEVYMDPRVDIDPNGDLHFVEKGEVTPIAWNINNNDKPMIYVSAYAVQVDGFDTVGAAYDAYILQWTANNSAEEALVWGEDDGATDWPHKEFEVETPENFEEAVAHGNNTITLTQDVTLPATAKVDVTAGKKAEINLNDYTLSTNPENFGGTLTISNGTVKSDSTANQYILNSRYGAETTITDVDMVQQGSGGGVAAAEGSKVVFESGSIVLNSKSTSGRYVFYAEGEGSQIEINGGDFSWSSSLNQKRAYICALDGTTVIVNGGNFGKASTRSGYTAGIMTEGTGKVIIYGGTFGFDPTTWVAEGYQAVKSGTTWTVSAK